MPMGYTRDKCGEPAPLNPWPARLCASIDTDQAPLSDATRHPAPCGVPAHSAHPAIARAVIMPAASSYLTTGNTLAAKASAASRFAAATAACASGRFVRLPIV